VRLGVLSDLHCELEPAGSRWINPFASERLDEMTEAALKWFARARIDLLVLLGDVVQFPRTSDLEHVFANLGASAGVPLVVVRGNHDLRLEESFAHAARRHGIMQLCDEPQTIGSVELLGVELERGPVPPQYRGRARELGRDARLVVLASHFPLLSEASRVAAAGIPYAGDLINRAELETCLLASGRPFVVLSGHIHARATTNTGNVLQFSVGALIEPPFDATIVEIDPDSARVRRTSCRCGAVAEVDPVFAPEEETWEWAGYWHPTNASG
jgi:predicted phosphodiesterase